MAAAPVEDGFEAFPQGCVAAVRRRRERPQAREGNGVEVNSRRGEIGDGFELGMFLSATPHNGPPSDPIGQQPDAYPT